jgi:acetyl-CoA carboxylase biotin carboxyl carrier protein
MKGSKKKPPTSDFPVPGLDRRQLERLLAFMSENGLEEFEYAHGDLRIRLKKASASAALHRAFPLHAVHGTAGHPASASAVTPGSSETTTESPSESPADNLYIIKSPIVGTFYESPNPESGPFVKLGDLVEAGRTVCIIEAMKLMNEIEADISGEVVQILVENGQPVEYGEPLFALRPTGEKK